MFTRPAFLRVSLLILEKRPRQKTWQAAGSRQAATNGGGSPSVRSSTNSSFASQEQHVRYAPRAANLLFES